MRGRKRRPVGWLGWLLPAAYLAHVAEEYLGDFPAWVERVAGIHLGMERFLELNAFCWLAMVLGVWVGTALRPARILLAALATAALANGILHAGATIVTGSYSPGAVTGVVLWIPVGWALLTRLAGEISRPLLGLGVLLGLALHGLVIVIARG